MRNVPDQQPSNAAWGPFLSFTDVLVLRKSVTEQLLYTQNDYTVCVSYGFTIYMELHFLWAVDFIFRISYCSCAADHMLRKKVRWF